MLLLLQYIPTQSQPGTLGKELAPLKQKANRPVIRAAIAFALVPEKAKEIKCGE